MTPEASTMTMTAHAARSSRAEEDGAADDADVTWEKHRGQTCMVAAEKDGAMKEAPVK